MTVRMTHLGPEVHSCVFNPRGATKSTCQAQSIVYVNNTRRCGSCRSPWRICQACILQPEEGAPHTADDAETGLCEFHAANGRTVRRPSLIAARTARFSLSDELKERVPLKPLRTSAGDDPDAVHPWPDQSHSRFSALRRTTLVVGVRDEGADAESEPSVPTDSEPSTSLSSARRHSRDRTPVTTSTATVRPSQEPDGTVVPRASETSLPWTEKELARTLTHREIRIMQECRDCKSNIEIAQVLDSTPNSVGVAVSSIYNKLGLSELPKLKKRPQLIAIARAAFSTTR